MSTDTELQLVPEGEELPTKRADTLSIWEGYREQAEKLKHTAETLTVTDVSQVAEMKVARATRLALKELRCEVENKRKELGEYHLRETQKINTAAKTIKEAIEPLEERLLDQEQFIAREELRIEDEKRTNRAAELTPFLSGPLAVDVGKLTNEQYAAILQDTKDIHQVKTEREQKAKEEAEAKAKSEADERERIRIENERLKKEAEEAKAETARVALIENRILAIREGETDAIRVCKTVESLEKEIAYVEQRQITPELFYERTKDAQQVKDQVLTSMRSILKDRQDCEAREKAAEEKARIEKEKADAEIARVKADAEAAKVAAEAKAKAEKAAAEKKAKAEREAREKAETELAAKKAAEEKAEADRKAQEKAAAMAPEKEKLLALAKTVLELHVPDMESEEGLAAATEIHAQIQKFAAYIAKKAEAL